VTPAPLFARKSGLAARMDDFDWHTVEIGS